jgi:hypothetical protein
MCAVDDCEPWDVYNDSHPVARTQHQCCECYRTVQPGEKYWLIKGLADHRWATYKLCRHCESLGNFMMVLCDGWPFTSLYAELVDHWREGYASIALGRLIVAMRRKWHDGKDPVPTGVSELAKSMMQRAVA